jgi:3-deoxy-D-manno-octulosonic-acid transferase
MGDLKKFYALAAVVFVGRSLAPMGGSDMMEPAALGKCTVFGPHTFNFKQTVGLLLLEELRLKCRMPYGLLNAVKKCLSDQAYAGQMAAAARDTIRRNQGATQKSIDAIAAALKS